MEATAILLVILAFNTSSHTMNLKLVSSTNAHMGFYKSGTVITIIPTLHEYAIMSAKKGQVMTFFSVIQHIFALL